MNLLMRVLRERVTGHHLSAAAAVSCSLTQLRRQPLNLHKAQYTYEA
jgi:hypothetical protein